MDVGRSVVSTLLPSELGEPDESRGHAEFFSASTFDYRPPRQQQNLNQQKFTKNSLQLGPQYSGHYLRKCESIKYCST